MYQTWVAVASLTKVNALSARDTWELSIRITRSRAVHFVRPVQAVRNAVALQLLERKDHVTYAISFCNTFDFPPLTAFINFCIQGQRRRLSQCVAGPFVPSRQINSFSKQNDWSEVRWVSKTSLRTHIPESHLNSPWRHSDGRGHLSSSEYPSRQSVFPSHLADSSKHSPESHCN